MTNNFFKQPSEEFFIYGSILNIQKDNEVVLDTSSVAVEDKDGTDVSSTIIMTGSEGLYSDPDGDYVNNAWRVGIQGGVAASSPYKITFLLDTNLNNVYEIDVVMSIRET